MCGLVSFPFLVTKNIVLFNLFDYVSISDEDEYGGYAGPLPLYKGRRRVRCGSWDIARQGRPLVPVFFEVKPLE